MDSLAIDQCGMAVLATGDHWQSTLVVRMRIKSIFQLDRFLQEIQIFRNCSQRPPGLGNIPRQKSLDSSLAAAQMNPMGSLHNRGPTQGSTSNLYNQ